METAAVTGAREFTALVLAQEEEEVEAAALATPSRRRRIREKEGALGDEEDSILMHSPAAGAAGVAEGEGAVEAKEAASPFYLIFLMFAMVFVGTLLTIVTKLQTIPMQNYPVALNIEATAAYVPIFFIYVAFLSSVGKLKKEDLIYPWSQVVVVAGIIAIGNWLFLMGSEYLSGPLQVLLMQVAIPFSMLVSSIMLNTSYKRRHYVGAVTVLAGIVIAVGGQLGGAVDVFEGGWIVGYLLCWIPFTIFTVYSEMLFTTRSVDPVMFNCVLSIIQLPLLLLLAPIFTYFTRPLVTPQNLPASVGDGFKCFIGINSLPNDDCWPWAPVLVIAYNILSILWLFPTFALLRHGSSNLVWLSNTLSVPLSNLAFSLSFMPQRAPLTASNGIALLVIVIGLLIYGSSKKTSRTMLAKGMKYGSDLLRQNSSMRTMTKGATSTSTINTKAGSACLSTASIDSSRGSTASESDDDEEEEVEGQS